MMVHSDCTNGLVVVAEVNYCWLS